MLCIFLAQIAILQYTPNMAGVEGFNDEIYSIPLSDIEEVVPDADLFLKSVGELPYYGACRGGELIALCFLTSDIEPEIRGYSGYPIKILAAINLSGIITGIKAISHYESGRAPYYLEEELAQTYIGKSIWDEFIVGEDIDAWTGATVTACAVAEAVRESGRKVFSDYMTHPPPTPTPTTLSITPSEFEVMSGGTVSLKATLTPSSAPSEMITWSVEGPGTLSPGIDASVTYEAPEVKEKTTVKITATFPGTNEYLNSSATCTGVILPPVKNATILTISPTSFTLKPNETVTLTATLKDVEGDILTGKTITWSIDGPGALSSTTGTSVTYTAPKEAAEEITVTITAKFSGDENYVGSTATCTGVVSLPVRKATTLEILPTSFALKPGETVTLTATLKDVEGNILTGKTITWSLDGPGTLSSTTGTSVTYTAPEVKEKTTVKITAAFPGTNEYLSSGGTCAGVILPTPTPTPTPLLTSDQTKSLFLLPILTLAIVGFIKKNELVRYVTLLGALVYIGFILARPICVIDVLNMLSLNLVALTGRMYWLLLIAFTMATTVLWGRIYCGWICPFGAAQEFLERVSPFKLRVPSKIHRVVAKAKYVVLLAIIVLFYFSNDLTLAMYVEPYGTLFLGFGSTLMWVILASILAISVVVHRFFCRYVCPVGAALGLTSLVRIFRIKRWDECKTCRICARSCKMDAIGGGEISVVECTSCGDCERNYRNTHICPHWLFEEKRALMTGGGR